LINEVKFLTGDLFVFSGPLGICISVLMMVVVNQQGSSGEQKANTDTTSINCTTLNWEYLKPHFEQAKDSKYTLTVVLREHSVAETYHEASLPSRWRNIREQDAQAQDEGGENL
jgi:hypothetical protein